MGTEGVDKTCWNTNPARCYHGLCTIKSLPSTFQTSISDCEISLSSQLPLACFSSDSPSYFLPKLIHSCRCRFVLEPKLFFILLLCIPLTYMVTASLLPLPFIVSHDSQTLLVWISVGSVFHH